MNMPEPNKALEARIATLHGSDGLAALLEALTQAEEDTVNRVARSLLKGARKPADQRKLDHTAGYFAGASFWLRERITAAHEITKREES